MSSEYASREELDALRDTTVNGLQSIKEALHDRGPERSPSKAHLLGGNFDPYGGAKLDTGSQPGFFHALWQARSPDHDVQADGKRRLEELGSRFADAAESKATLGTTDAGGGYLLPNALVEGVVNQATSANPFRRILTVVRGVRSTTVEIPYAPATTRAEVVAWGDTKPNFNVNLQSYSSTLYTLARIYDVSNQLLRHSGGAAEDLIRGELTRAIGLGEAYYVLNGSGSSQPKGLLTSIAGVSASMTTAHTASDSTVAGSVRAAVAKAIEALSDRDVEPDAVVMNSGDAAHAYVQGSDTAGFWVDEGGRRTLLGLPVVTTTAITGGTAIVGRFRSAAMFIGDEFRVDVSSEANDRWDKNLTGFRAEEEFAFNADAAVIAGNFQRITGLVP